MSRQDAAKRLAQLSMKLPAGWEAVEQLDGFNRRSWQNTASGGKGFDIDVPLPGKDEIPEGLDALASLTEKKPDWLESGFRFKSFAEKGDADGAPFVAGPMQTDAGEDHGYGFIMVRKVGGVTIICHSLEVPEGKATESMALCKSAAFEGAAGGGAASGEPAVSGASDVPECKDYVAVLAKLAAATDRLPPGSGDERECAKAREAAPAELKACFECLQKSVKNANGTCLGPGEACRIMSDKLGG